MEFKKYLNHNNHTYFLLAVGTKAQVIAARLALCLHEPHVIVYPFLGTNDGKVALYAEDINHISEQIRNKIGALNRDAKKLHLKTNVQQIADRGAEITKDQLIKKEAAAREELKQDKQPQPIPAPPQEPKQSDPPKSEPYTWKFPQGYYVRKSESQVIRFDAEDERERISEFKKKYMSQAVDTLKMLKFLFPEAPTSELVENFKSLKIDSTYPVKGRFLRRVTARYRL